MTNTVVSWATARSPAAGRGANHDRVGQFAQSKLADEPLATLDQGLGSR